jgi:hypothetical protein
MAIDPNGMPEYARCPLFASPARTNGYAQLKHPPYGRSASRLLRAVAIDEILALKRHPILDGDTAA